MDQTNSVFIPGLTRRGSVYNSSGENAFGALPALSPTVLYAAMAGLLYLGYAKKLPGGVLGGAAAAFALYTLFPTTTAPVAASGVPSAADISALTADAATIAPTPFNIPMPTVAFPDGSTGVAGYQLGNPSFYAKSPAEFLGGR